MKTILSALIILLLTVSSCDEPPFFAEKFYMLYVVNNTYKSIYYYEERVNSEFPYPDTTLPSTKPTMQKIEANDKYGISSQVKWNEVIDKMPSDTMAFYIFDAETIENTDWSVIRANYLVLKRYSISAEYLTNNNNTIVYP